MQHDSNDTIQKQFQSFQRGEESGFAHVFQQHYKALSFFANGLMQDPNLAEDILGDSFLKFFEKRATIQSADSIKSFLYTMVRNACLDKLRQQNSRAGHNKQFAYLQETIEPSAAEHLIRTETLSLILQAIEELPPASRTVFKLHYLEGKSYDEIAEIVGRSKETIRKQKQTALRSVQNKLINLKIFIHLLFITCLL